MAGCHNSGEAVATLSFAGGAHRRLSLLVPLVFVAACGSASTGPFSAKAQQIVSDVASGNFAAVTADFDATMRTALPLPALQNSWRTFQEQFGAYRDYGTPTSVMKGQLDVERVPVTMASGAEEVRVTFHPDGTIAGLFFLSANAPPP